MGGPLLRPSEQLRRVNPTPEHHVFSAELAKKNKAMEAYWSFLGLIGFITLIAALKLSPIFS